MSWICVGCRQVQETQTGFAPVLNHTHSVIAQQPPVYNEHVAPGCELFTAGEPAESQLQRDVRAALEKDGANADLIRELLGQIS